MEGAAQSAAHAVDLIHQVLRPAEVSADARSKP
jgi:hypothetical protein